MSSKCAESSSLKASKHRRSVWVSHGLKQHRHGRMGRSLFDSNLLKCYWWLELSLKLNCPKRSCHPQIGLSYSVKLAHSACLGPECLRWQRVFGGTKGHSGRRAGHPLLHESIPRWELHTDFCWPSFWSYAMANSAWFAISVASESLLPDLGFRFLSPSNTNWQLQCSRQIIVNKSTPLAESFNFQKGSGKLASAVGLWWNPHYCLGQPCTDECDQWS